jgi:peptide/nickel transport system ATP-binding protein
MSLVDVRDLTVSLTDGGVDIVMDVCVSIEAGEIVGLVGESGSGKTTTGLALLGHTRPGARITNGSVVIDGVDVLSLSGAARRRARGDLVSYVAQDPAAALNPALRIGKQLSELIEVHDTSCSQEERWKRISAALAEVKLAHDDPSFLERYPHQLSGGQQQRICIAMAFLLRPKAIVLDEPTTGLDVITQTHVLKTVEELCRSHQVAALYVTHDLAVVANLADRVTVMYAGRVVESGSRSTVFLGAGHPYTRRLLECIPDVDMPKQLAAIPGRAASPRERPPGCAFAPRCSWRIAACANDPPVVTLGHRHTSRCLRATEVVGESLTAAVQAEGIAFKAAGAPVLSIQAVDAWYGDHQVVFEASLDLEPRQCVAIVGESGSGKTTLARTVIGLHKKSSGGLLFEGSPISHAARERDNEVRRRLQYVFQSPYNSLNPRRAVGESIGVLLDHFFDLKRAERNARVRRVLEHVGLHPSAAAKYPAQLSGGERQRIAIARALVCEPSVLICDEITSALDVSVQAAIIELLGRLRQEDGLAMLFITHDLALARTIADAVVVMNDGRIVEAGSVDEIFASPSRDYTRELIRGTPSLVAAGEAGTRADSVS